MKQLTITLIMALFPTVVAHHVSSTSAPRGASLLRSAQHHRSGALIARVAVLRHVSHIFAAPRTTLRPLIHKPTTTKVPVAHPLRLVNALS